MVLDIIKATGILIFIGFAIYHAYWEVQCYKSEDPKGFECFMARGITLKTDNSIRFGFGLLPSTK